MRRIPFSDFATWCYLCDARATLDEVAPRRQGSRLQARHRPEPRHRAEVRVMSVPTMVFENGQVKNQAVGVQPKQNILSMIG